MSHVIWQWHNQSIHMTDSMTAISLSASLMHMIHVAMDHISQTALNQNLSGEFQKCCNYSNYIKAKSCKRNSHETRLACILHFSYLSV
jgi:hypothetical protein